MGLGASKSGGSSPEEQEEESMAASTGSLPMLQNAFAKLSDPETKAIPLNSLKEIFCLNFSNLLCRSSSIPERFPQLLVNLGPSIVDLFFMTGKEGVSWVDFLRGYNRYCGRMPASVCLTNLYKLYSATSRKTDTPLQLEFNADDGKITGSLKLSDVLMLLWMCWIMSRSPRTSKLPKDKTTLLLPDMYHLTTSAYISCNEVDDDSSIRDCNILDFEKDVSAQKLHLWVLTTVPGLAHFLSQYIQDKLQKCVIMEGDADSSLLSVDDNSSVNMYDGYLLTCGRAWAISLTLRSTMSEELLMACFSREETGSPDNLLYKSSIHGKGLSRFWSNIEGYHGSLLILVSAKLADTSEGDSSCRTCVIGILTGQGLENGTTFHGSSGYLYALSPIFRVLPPSGKDKNFVYCHLRATGRVYDPHPKPVGVAFGGTVGNERIFVDEDFAGVTVRHHAVDKTYQPGSLVPSQGFLSTEGSVAEVEVWGLGGKAAREHQNVYKNRELLFSEQRRKVDPKTFGSWEDSPEKLMMDMVSHPKRVQREDR